MGWFDKRVQISEFMDLEFTNIEVLNDQYHGDKIIFTEKNGRRFEMYHEQDCCESVRLEDVCGDITDLLDSPIKLASEDCHSGHEECGESQTWTYYKLATVKGYVDIRWYGTSNGYYSESVNIYETTPAAN